MILQSLSGFEKEHYMHSERYAHSEKERQERALRTFRALRAVFLDKQSSYKALMDKSDLVTLQNRRLQDIANLMYKVKHKPCPTKICERFYKHCSPYNLRVMEFAIPRFRTEKYGKHSFTYLGPKLCNKLPSEIRTLPLLLSFKNRICKFDLRQDFFELRALCGQKDHNNLLPPVKFSWNHVCFAPGNDFGGRFDHFDSYKVLFPLLISNLSRKDMKHFVVENPKDANGRFALADLP